MKRFSKLYCRNESLKETNPHSVMTLQKKRGSARKIEEGHFFVFQFFLVSKVISLKIMTLGVPSWCYYKEIEQYFA